MNPHSRELKVSHTGMASKPRLGTVLLYRKGGGSLDPVSAGFMLYL